MQDTIHSVNYIEKYHRNIVSMRSDNGTYDLRDTVPIVFQYLEQETNPVGYNIYQYIHVSDTFKHLQTNVLGLHKGVFSYLNPNKEQYVYLYGGEKDFEVDNRFNRKDSNIPSFLIKHYAFNSAKQWVDIDENDFEQRPLFRLYNRLHHSIRNNQVWSSSKIVTFFNFLIEDKKIITRRHDKHNQNLGDHNSLTHFQIKNQALVISSGEIDIKVLASIFIDQRQSIAQQIENGISLMDCQIRMPLITMHINGTEVNLNFDTIKSRETPDGVSHQYTEKSRNIFLFEQEALKVYFKNDDHEGRAATVSDQYVSMSELFHIYGVVNEDKTLNERGLRIIDWLRAVNRYRMVNVLFDHKIIEQCSPQELINCIPNLHSKDIDQIADFIWLWTNLRNNDGGFMLPTFDYFQDSTICMIDLKTQYYIRLMQIAEKKIPTNGSSVGWIAFPTLYASNVYEGPEIKNKVSGLFLGSFRDIDEKGNSFIEQGIFNRRWDNNEKNYKDNSLSERFKELISHFKLVVNPLAEIENAEVIHKNIARQKVDYEANKSIIANIFIRNIAHNLGTHVIPRAENTLLYELFGIKIDEASQKDDEALHVYLGRLKEYFKKIKYVNSLKKNLENYMSERQEFISDISPESFPMNTTCYFYRDVVLPFVENLLVTGNIAKSEGVGFADISSNCSLQIRVYRNYGKISGGKKIGYELKARYPFPDDSGGYYSYPNIDAHERFPLYIDLPAQLKITYDDFIKTKIIISKPIKDNNASSENNIESGTSNTISDLVYDNIDNQDVLIAMPSLLGRHSFYSILENIIRNSAKNHMETISKRTTPKLTISISVDDAKYSAQGKLSRKNKAFDLDENYSVRIWDDVTTFDDDEVKEIAIRKRYKNVTNRYNEEPHFKLREQYERLEKSGSQIQKYRWFLDFEDRLSSNSPKDINEPGKITLGLDDMRVSALILGGGLTKGGQNAFSAFKLENRYLNIGPRVDRNTPFFFYTFRLAKPKTFLICSPNAVKLSQSSGENVICFVKNVSEFRAEVKCDFCLINAETYNEKADFVKMISDHSYFLPNRIICYNVNSPEKAGWLSDLHLRSTDFNLEENRFLTSGKEGINNLTRTCWEIWLSRWRSPDNSPFRIFTDGVVGTQSAAIVDTPLVCWFDIAESDYLSEKKQEPRIIYTRHNKILSQGKVENMITLNGDQFYQNLEKNSLDFSRFYFLPQDDFGKEILSYRIAEAGLLKILVIDERVAELAARTNPADVAVSKLLESDKVQYHDSFRAQNIFICTTLMVNNKDILMIETDTQEGKHGLHISISGDQEISWDCHADDDKIVGLPTRFDALLIHRTKLKQISHELKVSDDAVVKMMRQHFPLFVINSGGGSKGVLGYKAKYFQHTLTMRFFLEKWFPKLAFTEKIVG